MKQILSLTLACILCATVNYVVAQPLATIKGTMNRDKVTAMSLYHVIEGSRVEHAYTRLNNEGGFAFAISDPKEGIYYLGPRDQREYTAIYLKPGMQLELDFNDTSYTVTKGSEENKSLHKWDTMSRVITFPAYQFWKVSESYVTYFPKLTAFLPKAEAFKKQINTKNKGFNELMKLVVNTDIEAAALRFLSTPRPKHPAIADHTDYYKQIIQPNKYCDTRILLLGGVGPMLTSYSTHFMTVNKPQDHPEKYSSNFLEWGSELFCNDTIKGLFVTDNLRRYKTFDQMETAASKVKQYLVTDSMQAAYVRSLKSVSNFKAGDKAYNFSYPDVTGKTVKLSDFKGKVVLVDVWATWCGPCKAEIPAMKKLEEELHGKNIEFVSISVDEDKDKEKWLKVIATEQLGGTQLFAKGWSEITQFYNINGIPRFMVFDQNGNIVTIDAPRPSTPELKALLLKTEASTESGVSK